MASILEKTLTISRIATATVRATTVKFVPLDGSAAYDVTMEPASPRMETIDEGGLAVSRRIDDWICEIADLQAMPQRGDIIEWRGETYKVTHPGGGRYYDYHDPYHQSLRIHTVVVPTRVTADAPYTNKDGTAYANPSDTAYAKPGQ